MASTSNLVAQRISQDSGEMVKRIGVLPPGISTAGAAWLMKALHPASVETSGVQLPDGTAGYTVPVETTVVVQVIPSIAPATPWGIEMSLIPHPTCIGEVNFVDGAAANLPYTIRNPLFMGVNADNDIRTLSATAEAWRLTHMSVTMHLDASATTNTGTVVAGQNVVKPLLFVPGATAGARAHEPILFHQPSDYPNYAALSQMPDIYHTNVLEGAYLPLHLSNTSQHWRSMRDVVGLGAIGTFTQDTAARGGWTIAAAGTPAWPNWDLSYAYNNAGSVVGGLMSSYLGDNFGRICVRNIATTASLVLKFKVGLELKIQPGSAQMPHMRPCPPADPLALQTYFAVVNSLPAAFPASYNDGGKILGVLSKAMKMILPAVGAIFPAAAPVLSVVGPQVVRGLDYGAEQLSRRQKARKSGKKFTLAPPAPPVPPRNKTIGRGRVKRDERSGIVVRVRGAKPTS